MPLKPPPKPKLSDSHIAELQAEKVENDHRRWLWKLSGRLALWISAVAAGGHTLITFAGDVSKHWGDIVKWLTNPK